jgi:glutamate synthase (NADPH/NADH) large chain
VVLGPVGFNFAAGMTGGMAFVHDPAGRFLTVVNKESVVVARIVSAHWAEALKGLVETHARETGSPLATELLHDWDRALGDFWQICPKEMLSRLEAPLADKQAELRA